MLYCVTCSFSLLWGEDTGLSINNYLTKHCDHFNIWARRFVETKTPNLWKLYRR